MATSSKKRPAIRTKSKTADVRRAKAKPITGDVYESFYDRAPRVSGVELGERAQGEGPNLLKRLRNWLGWKVLNLAARLLTV